MKDRKICRTSNFELRIDLDGVQAHEAHEAPQVEDGGGDDMIRWITDP